MIDAAFLDHFPYVVWCGVVAATYFVNCQTATLGFSAQSKHGIPEMGTCILQRDCVVVVRHRPNTILRNTRKHARVGVQPALRYLGIFRVKFDQDGVAAEAVSNHSRGSRASEWI